MPSHLIVLGHLQQGGSPESRGNCKVLPLQHPVEMSDPEKKKEMNVGDIDMAHREVGFDRQFFAWWCQF